MVSDLSSSSAGLLVLRFLKTDSVHLGNSRLRRVAAGGIMVVDIVDIDFNINIAVYIF